ncbi:hypothetical protein [Actinocorallia longicatena]|uniref:Lipoprotein n=1 Tax=Actinocorallia longicatena TaxID=111803 RepID=A0ABP6QBG5_9ACTN
MTKLVLTLVLAAAAVTACSAPDPRLNTQGGAYPLGCLEHQRSSPGRSYAAGASTGRSLELLRYYTANRGVRYCDGEPATGSDRAWAERYVALGADPANVAGILNQSIQDARST